MADHHVIVGAGAAGRAVAEHLAERGSHVTVVTRSGTNTASATTVTSPVTSPP